ncbi:MAG: universal stress protein, partial [Hyphomonas sp.]|nr:universal stress protein [Hyphomonas sp.]
MTTMKPRRSFEAGHSRKFLLVVDESAEVESALYYTAARVQRSSGLIVMLYVIAPGEYQHWMGVRQMQLEEETAKAKALFRLFRRKLNLAGFEDVPSEEIIREGAPAEEIVKHIAEDEDIAILVLGAATDAKGPGPLVSSL